MQNKKKQALLLVKPISTYLIHTKCFEVQKESQTRHCKEAPRGIDQDRRGNLVIPFSLPSFQLYFVIQANPRVAKAGIQLDEVQ
jgi:hypothetical protein